MKKNKISAKVGYMLIASGIVLMASCSKDKLDPTLTGSTAKSHQEANQEDAPVVSYNSSPIRGQYIVVLNENYKGKSGTSQNLKYKEKVKMLKDEIPGNFKNAGIASENIKHTFAFALKGFTATLNQNQLNALRKDERVKSIEQDYIIQLSQISPYKGKPGGGNGGGGSTPPPTQEVPWGIARVGGGAVYSGTSTAWIIDTGIDLDHPDLNVDVSRSISFLTGSPSNLTPDDQHGHGTHVAGTVAAIDNSIGVIGVAPGAKVVAVRVLDKRGSGTTSGVIQGVDYVAANKSEGDVANMSLGGGASSALDNAVIAAAESGVKFALAAGNESDDANNHSPARANHANIYTVSAMEIGDNWAYFSNFGNPPVDYCAPGRNVLSTWKGGAYNTISGTSMAAPHVCGLLLISNIVADGTVIGDPDENPDPIAHK